MILLISISLALPNSRSFSCLLKFGNTVTHFDRKKLAPCSLYIISFFFNSFSKRIKQQQMWTFTFLGLNLTFNLNKTLDCRRIKNIEHKTTNIKFKIKNEKKEKTEYCAWDLTKYTIYCFRFALLEFLFITPLTSHALFPHRISQISWRFDCRFCVAAVTAAALCFRGSSNSSQTVHNFVL